MLIISTLERLPLIFSASARNPSPTRAARSFSLRKMEQNALNIFVSSANWPL